MAVKYRRFIFSAEQPRAILRDCVEILFPAVHAHFPFSNIIDGKRFQVCNRFFIAFIRRDFPLAPPAKFNLRKEIGGEFTQ